MPAGVPSELIQRRPDILQPEYTQKAANANIGATRATFIPAITLTANAGSTSSELSKLFRRLGSPQLDFSPENIKPRVIPTALIASIAKKGSDKEAIARKLIHTHADLTSLVEGMSAKPAAVKFGCQKVLRCISEKDPALVYPYFERIAAFLDSENSILKWGAILILANLSAVDAERRLVALFNRYFQPIPGPEMIAAANVIGSAPKIARAYPELANRIKDEILKVQKAQYKTAECRNVAIGHALTALKGFYDLITDRQEVLDFVRKQLKNPRKPVAEKARKLLKNLDPNRNGKVTYEKPRTATHL